jgi:outer membrane protein, multidrug efflux system
MKQSTQNGARPRLPAILTVLPAMLCACAVGPNYKGPPEVAKASIDNPHFKRADLTADSPVPAPSRWWTNVDDPMLTRLIDEAFAASPTLESAMAQVNSARAQQAVDRAALGPTGGTSATYVRGSIPTDTLGLGGSSTSGSSSGSSGNASAGSSKLKLDTYSVAVDATWEIDLFGGKRRDLESATASAGAAVAGLEDAQVRLASDLAQAYAQLREAQIRVRFTQHTIDLRERALTLTQQRRALGTAAAGDIERAATDLAQSRAQLPSLQTQVEQQLDQIAVLAGREPGAYDALLAVTDDAPIPQPVPPEATPTGTPSDWLRRRPDIRQAERTLASRNALIGKNVASLFPSVSLLGVIGTTGTTPSQLFKGSPLWAAVPSLSWNFLTIPSTLGKIRGARADRDQSLADYRRTVLQALQDANDSLSRFGHAREILVQRAIARESAARAADMTGERYRAGTASLIDQLDTERQRVQTEDDWAQAEGDLMVSYATLQKSLGLGWMPLGTPSAPMASTGPDASTTAKSGHGA